MGFVGVSDHPPRQRGRGVIVVLCVGVSVAVCVILPSVAPAPVNHPVPLTERWDGHSWRLESNPVFDGQLQSVSCGSARSCTAVGIDRDTGDDLTLAERWNGSNWRIQRTPRVPGAQSAELDGVSCASPRACMAVGSYFDSASNQFTVSEGWDGSRWRLQHTPGISGNQGIGLNGVSCTSSRACTAVGSYTDTTGTELVLVERWNGHAWTIESAPTPRGAGGVELKGVWCSSARACVAVGDFTAATGHQRALIERWNGRTWSLDSAPAPHRTRDARLSGVSCSSGRACTATGAYSSTGPQAALVERWNGSRWTLQRTPASTRAALIGVSCPGQTFCTAVGYSSQGTLTERWDAIGWRIEHTPRPPGAVVNNPQLTGISCSSTTFCTAVGVYYTLP